MKKISLFSILVTLVLGICISCNSDNKNVLKEWNVSCAQDGNGTYEWEGTLYCTEEGVNWKNKDANEFLSQYLPNGNHWTISKDEMAYIGVGDTLTNGANSAFVELVTKNQKHYYLRAATAEENKKLIEFVIEHYIK